MYLKLSGIFLNDIGVPNRFFPEIIEQRFARELKSALAQAYGPSARLRYQVVNPEAGGSSERERELQAREKKQEVITPQTRRVLPLDPNLNPSCNSIACKAAHLFISEIQMIPSSVYNPFSVSYKETIVIKLI